MSFTLEQVAQHNKPDDCWIVIRGKVYDVTKFLADHPGGRKVLVNVAGKDATAQFDNFHKPEILATKYAHLCIGEIATAKKAPVAAKVSKAVKPIFGSTVPYGEPMWYQGFTAAPFYNDSHKRVRQIVREFVEKEIFPYQQEWDENRNVPRELLKKAGELGIISGVCGSYPLPKEYVTKAIGGVKPEEFNAFHELVILDEVSRAYAGPAAAICEGVNIGIAPVLYFGSKAIKDRVVPPCFSGDKVICLCITEPYAGSDVANIKTTAKKSPCGKYYIVNGEKKWITNGTYADYFTVAVRTDENEDSGMNGISMMLLERSMPGITTKPMKCGGCWSSGTSYITFEDVKVPVENLLGKEGHGFKIIMHNFNHERWSIVVEALRGARTCYDEAFQYAMKRKTFGKLLIDQPVIRAKLAGMIRNIEAVQGWLEVVTHQITTMSKEEQNLKLGGVLALMKVQATEVLENCVREGVNIFGGLGYTREGQGHKIERNYRDTKIMQIGGGAASILDDLGVRTARGMHAMMQKMPQEDVLASSKL